MHMIYKYYLKNIVLFNNNVNTFIYILNTDCCYSILVNMKFKNSLYEQSGKKNYDITSSDYNDKSVYIAKIEQMYDIGILIIKYITL